MSSPETLPEASPAEVAAPILGDQGNDAIEVVGVVAELVLPMFHHQIHNSKTRLTRIPRTPIPCTPHRKSRDSTPITPDRWPLQTYS